MFSCIRAHLSSTLTTNVCAENSLFIVDKAIFSPSIILFFVYDDEKQVHDIFALYPIHWRDLHSDKIEGETICSLASSLKINLTRDGQCF